MAIMSDREKQIYDSITDGELITPVDELPLGRVMVIRHALKGPYGNKLRERIEALYFLTDAALDGEDT